MSQLKPQSAVDTDFTDMTYPKMGFTKVDGVRGCHLTGCFSGRSLKDLGNRFTKARFSVPAYAWMDGEMTLDGRLTGPELCNLTNSAVSRSEGEPLIILNVFEYLAPDVIHLPYLQRYNAAEKILELPGAPHAKLLPYVWIENEKEARAFYAKCLKLKYEGAIFRNPNAMHKSGRATAKLQDFWRAKPVSDKDAIVLRVEEGQSNTNEATKNPLGRTERSTLASGMVPNGMVGTLICMDVETKQEIRVSPGMMKHGDRIASFLDQTLIVGHGIKYRSLDTGVKDAPRQARFVARRALADIV